jgi:hypothetical protein
MKPPYLGPSLCRWSKVVVARGAVADLLLDVPAEDFRRSDESLFHAAKSSDRLCAFVLASIGGGCFQSTPGGPGGSSEIWTNTAKVPA